MVNGSKWHPSVIEKAKAEAYANELLVQIPEFCAASC